jgi:hypothetical protein
MKHFLLAAVLAATPTVALHAAQPKQCTERFVHDYLYWQEQQRGQMPVANPPCTMIHKGRAYKCDKDGCYNLN